MTTAELLRKAAAVLDDGSSPLENWFLTENDVTLDQAYQLAGLLATGARIIAAAVESPGPERTVMTDHVAREAMRQEGR